MSSYHGSDMLGVWPRVKLLDSLKKAIKRHITRMNVPLNDLVLVGTGISGVAMASTLSYMLGCEWGFIRKDTDTNNHGGDWYPTGANHYIIAVDDFISSGDTIRKIANHVDVDAVAVDILQRVRQAVLLSDKWLTLGLPSITLITPHGEWDCIKEEEAYPKRRQCNDRQDQGEHQHQV